MATNLGTACMSIEGIAHFSHRYFHHCTEIATLACLNQRKNGDRNYQIPLSVRRCAQQRKYLKEAWYLTARGHQLLSMESVLYSKKGLGADGLYSAFVFEAGCGMEGKMNHQPIC